MTEPRFRQEGRRHEPNGSERRRNKAECKSTREHDGMRLPPPAKRERAPRPREQEASARKERGEQHEIFDG